jgi:hypothetical protein
MYFLPNTSLSYFLQMYTIILISDTAVIIDDSQLLGRGELFADSKLQGG